MAQFAISDFRIEVNSVDLSDHVKSATVNLRKDQIDDSAMGDTAHSVLGGLENNEVTVQFQQDFAASEVDATIHTVWAGTSAVTLKVRPTSSAISATNPEYQFSAKVLDYPPIDGEWGSEAMTTVTFLCTTTATRATS